MNQSQTCLDTQQQVAECLKELCVSENHHQDWPKTGFQSLSLYNGHFYCKMPVSKIALHDKITAQWHDAHKCNLNAIKTAKDDSARMSSIRKELNAQKNDTFYLPLNFYYVFQVALFGNGKQIYEYQLSSIQIPMSLCLKTTEKVSFNNASEASYVHILNGQKFIRNAKNGQFGEFLLNLKLAVKPCYQIGQF